MEDETDVSRLENEFCLLWILVLRFTALELSPISPYFDFNWVFGIAKNFWLSLYRWEYLAGVRFRGGRTLLIFYNLRTECSFEEGVSFPIDNVLNLLWGVWLLILIWSIDLWGSWYSRVCVYDSALDPLWYDVCFF